VVNQCGLDLRDFTRSVLTFNRSQRHLWRVCQVYICISLNRGQHSSTHLYISLLQRDRPPFTPVQQTGEGKQRMCLSCSSDAVPCDTLVGMLFFQLPLGAWNNLAVPMIPELSLSADTATWLAFAMTTKNPASAGVIYIPPGPTSWLDPFPSCTSLLTTTCRGLEKQFSPARRLEIIQKHLLMSRSQKPLRRNGKFPQRLLRQKPSPDSLMDANEGGIGMACKPTLYVQPYQPTAWWIYPM
jgi:hypothetical protein